MLNNIRASHLKAEPVGAVGGWVFAITVAFVLVVGLLLQLLIIPLTPWHAGSGLLAGGDWVVFQRIAVHMADAVHNQGWSAWSLRPEGQAPSGIAAAVYALSGISQPWVLLPVNAILYGMTAVCLFRMFFLICGRWYLAIFGILPLFFFPSTALLYSQLHKDIWSLAGFAGLVMFLVSSLLDLEGMKRNWFLFFCVLSLSNGAILLVRPYAMNLVLLAEAIVVSIMIATWRIHRQYGSVIAVLAGCLLTVVLSQGLWPSTGDNSSGPAPVAGEAASEGCVFWRNTIPVARVDALLKSLSCVRNNMIRGYPDAGSNIDINVHFYQAADVLAYVPRAIQIALFSPFPDRWFATQETTRGRFFQMVATAETFMMYIMLLGLFQGIVLHWYFGGSPGRLCALAMLIAFVFCFGWVLVYALSVVNVGSLYRVRLPASLVWFGLGVLGWSQTIRIVRDSSSLLARSKVK